MKLTIVGCSGSMPGPASAASCYLVTCSDASRRTWRMVLDLGCGASGPLQRHVNLSDVDAVCLSHLHPDHCLDMWGMFVALKYGPTGPVDHRVDVYAPPGAAEQLAGMLGLSSSEQLTDRFAFHEWVPGWATAIGPCMVTPFEAVHPIRAFSLRVVGPSDSGGQAVLAYSGDTDDCDGVRAAAQGADVFLCESSFSEDVAHARGIHLTGRRAGAVARDVGARRLLLTHVPPSSDPAVALLEARAVYEGSADVVHPEQQYTL